jgi:hypothetical protein
MTAESLYSSLAARTNPPPGRATESIPADGIVPGRYLRALRRADRACCCTARPTVVVIIPATASRPDVTELLFCMHHYRASRAALAEAGAAVVDATGRSLTGLSDVELVAASR